jgi:hypothetical protein
LKSPEYVLRTGNLALRKVRRLHPERANPYHLLAQTPGEGMSSATKATFVNAIPMLALGAAIALGVAVLAGGSGWLLVAAGALALIAAAGLLRRPSARAEGRQAAPAPSSGLSAALAEAETDEDVARLLTAETVARLGVDFAGLARVDGTAAHGVLGVLDGSESGLFSGARFDLEREPSAIASAAFEAAPLVVYDMSSSPLVHRDLTREMQAKSGMFVPLVAGERVVGVLAAIATQERRAFTGDELAVARALAAEAAPALERLGSATARTGAPDREQLVASIARRVRDERDPVTVLLATLADLGTALRPSASPAPTRRSRSGRAPPSTATARPTSERRRSSRSATRSRRSSSSARRTPGPTTTTRWRRRSPASSASSSTRRGSCWRTPAARSRTRRC